VIAHQLCESLVVSRSIPIQQMHPRYGVGVPSVEQVKPDDPSKVLNLESGRWIGRGGVKYNDLIKRGVIVAA
jgi:hypothetical protein